MTDRYYPVGLPQEADAWKTTYAVQNEKFAFPRSSFPPGTAVHLPGSREKFGYASPGPVVERLTRPEKKTFTMESRDPVTEEQHSHSQMASSCRSPGGRGTISGMGGFGIRKSCSLPGLARTTAPPRTSEPPQPTHSLEDEHFSYFVPRGMHGEGQEKMNPHLMSKLSKKDRISFPFSGEGTGFRSQGGGSDWMVGSPSASSTTYRNSYTKPAFFGRKSPVKYAPGQF